MAACLCRPLEKSASAKLRRSSSARKSAAVVASAADAINGRKPESITPSNKEYVFIPPFYQNHIRRQTDCGEGGEAPISAGRLLRRWAAICRLRYRPLEEAGGEKAEHQAVGAENPEFAAPDQTNQDGQREVAENARDDHADEGVPCGKPGQQRFACFL